MRAGSSGKVNHLLSVPQSRDQCLNQSSNQNKCSSLRGFWLWYCRLIRWAEVVRPLPFPSHGRWGGVGRGREEDGGWGGVRPASQRHIGGKLSRTEPTCRNLGVTHLCTSGAPQPSCERFAGGHGASTRPPLYQGWQAWRGTRSSEGHSGSCLCLRPLVPHLVPSALSQISPWPSASFTWRTTALQFYLSVST